MVGRMDSHDVVVVAYDGSELLDIASVTSTFDLANRLGAHPAYRVAVASVAGGDVRCDSGVRLRAHARLSAVPRADTVVVSGGLGHAKAAEDQALLRHLRRWAGDAMRVGSVCTGATVLAATGLLDGRRATTHWWYAAELAARFPAVDVDAAPIFVRDGQLATAGGVTSSLDLTLAFVEEDHGAELARRVSMGLVTYLQRPGNQAQMSMFTRARRPDHVVLRQVMDHAVAEPGGDLRTTTLAAEVGVSVRQLTRLFHDHLGESPAAAVRRVRLEVAASLVTTTDLALSQVAVRCGFSSAETLRQAFVTRYGVNPRSFRRTHRSSWKGRAPLPATTKV
jgi:transcriptional regulator GlxA family with amidase domain